MPVVIAGGGPAGASAAIALCNLGIDCMVINNGKKGSFTPGESLAPNTIIALQQLEADHILQSADHISYTGNEVVWGSDEARSRYFFNEPFGNGWHLDRCLFEQQLLAVATERGADWQEGWRISEVKRAGNKMHVSCTGNNNTVMQIECDWVLDCTGRASVVARKLGVRKQTIDRLAAFCFVLEQAPGPLSGISFIESVNDGWWYAAPVSNDKIVVNFMTDSDQHDVKKYALEEWIFQKLHQARHLPQHVQITHASQILQAQIRTATTSFLEKAVGTGWISAGDALCSYDPLTSFGITAAIANGYRAASVIKDCTNGNGNAMRNYISIQQEIFNKSMAMLLQQYRLEGRWNNYAFWQRRH